MITFPNAKLNLGLHVIRKRYDGYHYIETVLYPIPLKDALEIVPAEEDSLEIEGLPIAGNPEDNLVMKALKLMREQHSIPPLRIILHKTIPTEAGLGGGSADGSFMLKMLNNYAKIGLPDEQLEQMAAKLGGDCPFFIKNRPRYATGKGEHLEALEISLKDYYICLVKPDIKVSTQEAYTLVVPQVGKVSIPNVVRRPVREWRDVLENVFEEPIMKKHPQIKRIRDKMYAEGADYAAMSGSGSAVFGLFRKETNLENDFPGCFVWQSKML